MTFKEKVAKKLSDTYHTYVPALLNSASELKVECPCCGWKGPEFLPNGVEVRRNARCPKCDSLERHRMYYLYLRKKIVSDKKLSVLHFAPERILTRLFRSYENIDYVSADIDPKKAMRKEDITGTSFADSSFDIIFCSHVLEHIEDDHKAMRELMRILKPDGFAILLVPIKEKFNGKVIVKTYEDFTIRDPEQREKVFGQKDHVRIYGRDYKDRLEKAGFRVTIDKFIESLPADLVERYALLPQHASASETDGWIYYCTR
jgi:SAM-dependent methyltransferase